MFARLVSFFYSGIDSGFLAVVTLFGLIEVSWSVFGSVLQLDHTGINMKVYQCFSAFR